ncbi:MAG: endonuclease III [Nanoarchaeota archaeon]|nr:endonuclease III [Nanoarchaeota archaeon]MBU1445561.1 endonuclease III [Nanoarchaeota archaeon]MBU2406385.1 endonuclease III [Nanoarchaeota archaeon]MBU2420758.1 endonuclease III [Nanoarchaeota archaeon]MBU2475450.1 endonuclease III [Nanoarchaeota archaeon]
MEIDKIMSILGQEYKQKAVVSSKDPFKVLISTVLSQRTKDANTTKASKQLFEKASTPKEILKLKSKELEDLIRPSGFYKQKAKKIKEICQIILKEYNGKVPDTIEEMIKLPGVGRKTANCTLVYGFGKPGVCVDVHVHRISNRLNLVKTKTPEQTESELRKTLPKKYWKTINNLLVKHGQNVCKSKPKCENCPIKEHCDAGK